MTMKMKRTLKMGLGVVLVTFFAFGFVFSSFSSAMAADQDYRIRETAQGIVDRAMVTLTDFLHDPHYVWLHENFNQAKAVLVFPQVIEGGFLVGGSGGTGVLLVRDEAGNWSQPAFYTLASAGFGPLIGAEVSQVIMVAMTDRAVNSILESSFQMGGDASFAVGSMGSGIKATRNVPRIGSDFVAFSKSKGLYAGLNLGGTDLKVRHNLNRVYYHADVRPVDILVRKSVTNYGSARLLDTVRNAG
jgi:SH3 domain-containing YSC84-like protein 1